VLANQDSVITLLSTKLQLLVDRDAWTVVVLADLTCAFIVTFGVSVEKTEVEGGACISIPSLI